VHWLHLLQGKSINFDDFFQISNKAFIKRVEITSSKEVLTKELEKWGYLEESYDTAKTKLLELSEGCEKIKAEELLCITLSQLWVWNDKFACQFDGWWNANALNFFLFKNDNCCFTLDKFQQDRGCQTQLKVSKNCLVFDEGAFKHGPSAITSLMSPYKRLKPLATQSQNILLHAYWCATAVPELVVTLVAWNSCQNRVPSILFVLYVLTII